MNRFKSLSLAAAVAAIGFTAAAPEAQAQAQVEPMCPYGYYDYAPYACAPYGYYGPEWFTGGAFIGAGPWFHGREDFRGAVDHRFDVNRGYGGALPERGERPDASHSLERMAGFSGTEMHDGRGHGSAMAGGGGHEGGGGGGHEGGGGGRH
jgi:uncharacterized membrane protein YgcG